MQVSLLTSGSLFSTSSFLTRPFSRLILLRSTIDDTSSSVTMPKSFMSDVARAEAHRSLTWYLKHLFFKKHFLVQRSKSHIWRGGEDFCYSDSRVFWIRIRNTDPGPFKIRKSLQKNDDFVGIFKAHIKVSILSFFADFFRFFTCTETNIFNILYWMQIGMPGSGSRLRVPWCGYTF